jgi:hypothetical protein
LRSVSWLQLARRPLVWFHEFLVRVLVRVLVCDLVCVVLWFVWDMLLGFLLLILPLILRFHRRILVDREWLRAPGPMLLLLLLLFRQSMRLWEL